MLYLGTMTLGAPSFPSSDVGFRPTAISLSALRGDPQNVALHDALITSGMVSITKIPHYAEARAAALRAAHECLLASPTPEGDHLFDDGTKRSTLASVPGQEFAGCTASGPIDALREIVDQVARSFGARLSSIVGDDRALLTTRDGSHSFDSIASVLEAGHVLEHFHAYAKQGPAARGAAAAPTVGMHTDQGLFIGFVPAAAFGAEGALPAGAAAHGDVFVELANGRVELAALDPDSLVFMLGDGVEQFVNPALRARGALQLRATPHAVAVRATGEDNDSTTRRVWYGRMFLPPLDALAAFGRADGHTYGELRETIRATMASNAAAAPMSLGCAGDAVIAHGKAAARRRAEDTDGDEVVSPEEEEADDDHGCEEDEIYCWHRCMRTDGMKPVYASYGETDPEFYVRNSPDASNCWEEHQLLTQCANTRGQLAPGEQHGDFYPTCTNTTEMEVPADEAFPVPGALEREALGCDLAEYIASDTDAHGAVRELWAECGGGWNQVGEPCLRGMLAWNRTADGKVAAKMVIDGLFGWLSFGFKNEGGDHNGMNGAHVVWGAPSAIFSDVTGFDTSAEAGGPVVNEHIIDPYGSSFRHWQEPHMPDMLSDTAIEQGDCFTSMQFTTDHIAGLPLPASGDADYIWGFNDVDEFAGYHGRDARGHILIDWSDGDISHRTSPPPSPSPPPSDDSLDGAAIFGIILGGVTVLLAAAAAGVYFTRRNAAKANLAKAGAGTGAEDVKVEVQSTTTKA